MKTMWTNSIIFRDCHESKIVKISVEKETVSRVYVRRGVTGGSDGKGLHCCHKTSSDVAFRDTWEEVKQFMLETEQIEIDRARRILKHHQDRYDNIKGMKKPEGAE